MVVIILSCRVIRVHGAMKHSHEFRDPIHTFISVRTDERKVIDSRPFQRLRHVHQLALSYLVYPGATQAIRALVRRNGNRLADFRCCDCSRKCASR